jgi:predicted GNAT family acetyltransferase
MAGERMHPRGWTEISAVATDPDFRRQGLAGRLVRTVVAGVRARGEQAFLHAAADNVGAIAIYRALGFADRRVITFRGVRPPRA